MLMSVEVNELPTDMPSDYPLVHRWAISPNLRLEGDYLCYDPRPSDPKDRRWAKRPTARLLWDFAQLAEADGKAILEYACKWGALGLCRHGEISGIWWGRHSDDTLWDSRICEPTRREPLEDWRYHAEVFGDLLSLIERGRAEPIKAIVVTIEVNRIAATFGRLRPVLAYTDSGELALRLSGSSKEAGLASALAYQIMLFRAGTQGLYLCAGCGKWFEPRHGQHHNQSTYCQGCGTAAAWRAASKRYYQRRKLAKGESNGAQTA